ncbi:heterokaryon incompatibility protein-domain-containing protein [Bombardia bombarda]|uniref:Heterokaryon incompatibility protein-domain-containing protein n=1 Tax=Bombardia bombarda TaxID=252184 RepID=A0AA39XIE6_9PEZI|nr:heterokaryon incompatibility protein-domain-containing protein [Bombardia bombarda]
MESWHDTPCNRPDVILVEGNPFCMSCGSLAAQYDIDTHQLAPAPPIPRGRRGDLMLSWPSSVSYVNTCYGADGRDVTSDVVEMLAATSTDFDASLGDDVNISSPNSLVLTAEQDTKVSSPTMQHLAGLANAEPSCELIGTDSIRILCLSQGEGSEPLHGTLKTYQRKYFPEYEALSYTWADANGVANRTGKIYLGNYWSIFPITSNCEAALRSLRLPTKERLIWVDSICINQSNTIERSHQVQLMPIIYATAQHVIIYIGNDKPYKDTIWLHMSLASASWNDEWRKVDEHLKRPYFFRSWIIQEIAVAKRASIVRFDGTSWHEWPIHKWSTMATMFLPWLKDISSLKYKTPNDLVDLVLDSWTAQASDPRDKIFSLLGLTLGAPADGLVADYSLSMEHIYTGFAAFAIKKLGMTEILKYAGGYENYGKSKSLPSWVPDWNLLSRSWGIMARIQYDNANITQKRAMYKLHIASDTMSPMGPPDVDRFNPPSHARFQVHGSTGALRLPGFKVAELPMNFPDHNSENELFHFDGLYLITAPPNADTQDSVFFLQGLDLPVILRRKVAGRNDIFTFIGMCHIMSKNMLYQKMYSHKRGSNGARWTYDLIDWSVLHIPPHDYTAGRTSEICTALRSISERNLKELVGWEIQLFKKLGRETHSIWRTVIQDKMGHSSRFLEQIPVGLILDDLKRAIKSQNDFWVSIGSQLEIFRQFSESLPESTRKLVSQSITELETKREAFQRALHEETANRYERPVFVEPRLGYDVNGMSFTIPVPLDQEFPSLFYCPKWYLYQPKGYQAWLDLLEQDYSCAVDLLRNATMGNMGEGDGGLIVAGRYKELYEAKLLEIDLAKRSMTMLIEEEKITSPILLPSGWEYVVIV